MPRRGAKAAREAIPYVPYEKLAARPHIMVDGAPRPTSVLTLSHWPRTPTPPVLARDLSCEIAFAYLATTEPAREMRRLARIGSRAEAVTCDHFDEDGVLSVLVLSDPGLAADNAHLLVEAARCGDFGVVTSETAARVAFSIGPLSEREAGAGASDSERVAAVLPLMRELCAHPERYEVLYRDELDRYRAGREAIERGEVMIETFPEDLAVVTWPGLRPRYGEIHPAALHSVTECNRVLLLADCPELYLRYESWVRLVSRRVPLRPDLQPLAAELTSIEPGGAKWEATGPGAIVSRLRPTVGSSELSPDVLVARVRSYLAAARPAWDPFAAPP